MELARESAQNGRHQEAQEALAEHQLLTTQLAAKATLLKSPCL